MALDFTYPNILALLQRHLVNGRTESRAFLAWFLEQYYRLEEVAAQDAVCDGPDDRGIDGLYVDSTFERIDVLQSKMYQNVAKTLGDTPLKEFVGTLAQLQTPEGIEHIVNTTANQELANLLKDSNISALVADGYTVRGVFLTNAVSDANAKQFLHHQPGLVLYDVAELKIHYIATEPSAPIATPFSFDTSGYDVVDYRTGNARAIFAPLLASELTSLEGLPNGELFVWNVRQSLGKTKVNKEIGKSIEDQAEHKNFLLYHNGLTILCEAIDKQPERLTISGYNVVNGCQSLTSLYEKRHSISNELRVLARLVELAPDSELASKITHHSNNQNSISARDLQSNSVIQRRLQNEFHSTFQGSVFYKIKRGEQTNANLVIENEDAARILLAFDLQQPWSCHQTYKLFDELHAEIFARPEVDATRIYTLYRVNDVIVDSLDNITNQLMARYSLTRFFLLYLLRETLNHDAEGNAFCRNPKPYLNAQNGEDRLVRTTQHIMADLIVDLNAEIHEREQAGNPIDYKRELKSLAGVRKLAHDIIPAYQKAVNRGRAASFGDEWNAEE